jgi:hypothetical protein
MQRPLRAAAAVAALSPRSASKLRRAGPVSAAADSDVRWNGLLPCAYEEVSMTLVEGRGRLPSLGVTFDCHQESDQQHDRHLSGPSMAYQW